jgi:hypothetical protein
MRSTTQGFRDRISNHFSSSGRERRAPKYLVAIIAALSGGCSIHPLQQDVTGVPTPDLVQYIRCETRLAIQDKAIALLRDEKHPNPRLGDLAALRGKRWPPDVRGWLDGFERALYDRYVQTGIAFDFSFDITEDNAGSGIADPIKLLTNGTAGVGLSASGDFKRENLRHFIVSDTALDLLQNEKIDCSPSYDYRASNYAYPISGKIGIDELVSTFFDLNEIKNLAPDKGTSTVFADTLTFTTTLTGSVSPHVIVAPVGNRWGFAAPADIVASAMRVDTHKLIIGLSLDEAKGTAGRPVAAAAVVPGYAGKSALQKGNVRSATEQSALNAVSQARIDAYLDRAFH